MATALQWSSNDTNTDQTKDNSIVVVAVSGKRSRRAVRWASVNLIPHASRIVLVNVIPPMSAIPNFDGDKTPIDEVGLDALRLFKEDRLVMVRKGLESFRNLCQTRRDVEIVVLVGEDPAVEVLRYVAISGFKNLVLGASTFTWFTKTVKGMDVPNTVLKSIPENCNLFIVSRWKVVCKLAGQKPFVSDSSSELRKVRLNIFTETEGNTTSDEQVTKQASYVEMDSSTGPFSEWSMLTHLTPLDSVVSTESDDAYGPAHSRRISDLGVLAKGGQFYPNLHKKWPDEQRFRSRSLDIISSDLVEVSQDEVNCELEKLRLELKITSTKYNHACKELIVAKNKIETLSVQRSEEAKKARIAMEREEELKQIAEEERSKNIEAMKEIKETKRLLALFSGEESCKRYSEDEIIAATDNFSDSKKIGSGGYGVVYGCNLDDTQVAIKVLDLDVKGSNGNDQFLREVEVLTKLKHPRMVTLVGVCPGIQSLVYEYMENGSLEDRLFCKGNTPPLPWSTRFDIIYEVACGLAFLHGHNNPDPVVHCDMKPSNILLDRNYNSKIGDVGMSRFMSQMVATDTVMRGSMYYLDPEYHRTGRLRPESDVYALGMIMLQVLTARHPLRLLVEVEDALSDGSFNEILDSSLPSWPLEEAEKLAQLALRCSSLRGLDRPDLKSEVIPELQRILNLPH